MLAVISCLLFSSAAAFWDAGHMLIGEVAVQYMEPQDVEALRALLSKWDDEFPNTGEITTATQWADIVKCDKHASYCPSPLLPSVKALNKFHYVGLNLKIPKEENITTEELFDAATGDAHEIMRDTLETFKTTKSTWAANFMLRFFLHTFGDIHQPLHTTNGISNDFPEGDQGGNKYRFEKPCEFFNLHAMWDSTAGMYSHLWNMTMDHTRMLLKEDALQIRQNSMAFDKFGLVESQDMTYGEFCEWMKRKNSFNNIIIESYELARDAVYAPLNLTLNDAGRIECPSSEYVHAARDTIIQQIHLGGYRLSFVLTQLARQTLALGLI